MNKITIDNYEAYLLDFSEGTLSEEMQMELELFLMQHPELDIDLNELSLITIADELPSFNEKEKLKKTVTDIVSTEQLINYVEGNLTNAEKVAVDVIAHKNQEVNKELKLYLSTVLSPDNSIVFPNKSRLKHQTKVIVFKPNWSVKMFSAAASVVLLLTLYFLWPSEQNYGTGMVHLAQHKASPSVKPASLLQQNDIVLLASNTKSNATSSIHNKANKIKQNSSIENFNTVASNTNTANETVIPQNYATLNSTNTLSTTAVASSNTTTAVSKALVNVITESDDDLVADNQPKKKKGIWALAEKTLKNLNAAGVKSVDGEETQDTRYALTLGPVSITHKSH